MDSSVSVAVAGLEPMKKLIATNKETARKILEETRADILAAANRPPNDDDTRNAPSDADNRQAEATREATEFQLRQAAHKFGKLKPGEHHVQLVPLFKAFRDAGYALEDAVHKVDGIWRKTYSGRQPDEGELMSTAQRVWDGELDNWEVTDYAAGTGTPPRRRLTHRSFDQTVELIKRRAPQADAQAWQNFVASRVTDDELAAFGHHPSVAACPEEPFDAAAWALRQLFPDGALVFLGDMYDSGCFFAPDEPMVPLDQMCGVDRSYVAMTCCYRVGPNLADRMRYIQCAKDNTNMSIGRRHTVVMSCSEFITHENFSRKITNVKRTPYLLLEMDHAEPEVQKKILIYLIRQGWPIACVTFSGNRSYHALLKTTANGGNLELERAMRRIIYAVLKSFGYDEATKDITRLTRCPGLYRWDERDEYEAIYDIQGERQRCLYINGEVEGWPLDRILKEVKLAASWGGAQVKSAADPRRPLVMELVRLVAMHLPDKTLNRLEKPVIRLVREIKLNKKFGDNEELTAMVRNCIAELTQTVSLATAEVEMLPCDEDWDYQSYEPSLQALEKAMPHVNAHNDRLTRVLQLFDKLDKSRRSARIAVPCSAGKTMGALVMIHHLVLEHRAEYWRKQEDCRRELDKRVAQGMSRESADEVGEWFRLFTIMNNFERRIVYCTTTIKALEQRAGILRKMGVKVMTYYSSPSCQTPYAILANKKWLQCLNCKQGTNCGAYNYHILSLRKTLEQCEVLLTTTQCIVHLLADDKRIRIGETLFIDEEPDFMAHMELTQHLRELVLDLLGGAERDTAEADLRTLGGILNDRGVHAITGLNLQAETGYGRALVRAIRARLGEHEEKGTLSDQLIQDNQDIALLVAFFRYGGGDIWGIRRGDGTILLRRGVAAISDDILRGRAWALPKKFKAAMQRMDDQDKRKVVVWGLDATADLSSGRWRNCPLVSIDGLGREFPHMTIHLIPHLPSKAAMKREELVNRVIELALEHLPRGKRLLQLNKTSDNTIETRLKEVLERVSKRSDTRYPGKVVVQYRGSITGSNTGRECHLLVCMTSWFTSIEDYALRAAVTTGKEIPEGEIFRTTRNENGSPMLKPVFNRGGGLNTPSMNLCMQRQMAIDLIQALNRGIIRDDANADYYVIAVVKDIGVVTALQKAFPGARIKVDKMEEISLFLHGDDDGKALTYAEIARRIGKTPPTVEEKLDCFFRKAVCPLAPAELDKKKGI